MLINQKVANPGSGLLGDNKRNFSKTSVTSQSSKVALSTPLTSTPLAKTLSGSTERNTGSQSTTTGTAATTDSSDTLAAPKIKWYGHEANAKKAWLYFEIAGDAEADWSIENRVFFELNDDQLNHVQWSGTGKTETLVCDSDNSEISLPKK